MVKRGEEGVLNWFEHIKTMSEEKLIEGIFFRSRRDEGKRRLNWSWKDGMKDILNDCNLMQS